MRILFWFRNDLRLDRNTGLSGAERDARGHVVPFYASEPEVLSRPDMAATRVRFVLDSLADLAAAIRGCGSRLALSHGGATDTVVGAAKTVAADAVYWNDEYEPQLVQGATQWSPRCAEKGSRFGASTTVCWCPRAPSPRVMATLRHVHGISPGVRGTPAP
jgi:deoxyribodipyrimidine photolyase